MTKSSIAALCLAAGAVSLCPAAKAANQCVVLRSAPDSHTVQQGDTLWHIAARFLQNPWCWQAVWSTNHDQIRDPHWIYPGQRIVLDRTQGKLHVAPDESPAVAAIRRSPAARGVAAPKQSPIPMIAPRLADLASRYRLLAIASVSNAPRIADASEGRRLAVPGDTVAVTGLLPESEILDVMRELAPLQGPDGGAPLWVPVLRVGQVRQLATRGPQRLQVLNAEAELMRGDLLVPSATARSAVLVPHAAPPLQGKIAAVLRESRWASQHDVVALNKGMSDGLTPGSVVEVLAPDTISTDTSPAPSSRSIAALLVFEAVEQSALALVMQSRDALRVDYPIRSPSPNERP